MKGKDEKEKHKKEVVFHSSQKRMCSETWNTVSCTFHCHFSFSFPISPASPPTCSFALICQLSPISHLHKTSYFSLNVLPDSLFQSYFYLYSLLLSTDLGLIILNVSLQLAFHLSLLPNSPDNYPKGHTPSLCGHDRASQSSVRCSEVQASTSVKHHGSSMNFPLCVYRNKWYN